MAQFVGREQAARLATFGIHVVTWPWANCTSTHCERRRECASPHECSAKKPAPPPPQFVVQGVKIPFVKPI